MPKLVLRALTALLLSPPAARAQTQAPPPPCTAPEYRQFDFWEGNWDVFDPAGQQVGTNRIERVFGGCVLQENWVAMGPQKQTGSSFNTWSPGSRKWYQTWVDDTGGFLILSGEFVDGKMILTGEMMTPRGMVNHRITWNRINDDPGQVRQYWETSSDSGQTWGVAFDGIYKRHQS